ncbi:MAG: sigma-54 interaction domain-containing protein [Candidatus Anammoxibacter sp.]
MRHKRSSKNLKNEEDGVGCIIGKHQTIRELRNLILKVSLNESNVLITGETGTGKGIVANAIHFSGSRKKQKFVPVNSVALPETILESELFGHEKGAFTGAICRKAGKFEFADKGTLFFDEIGDISLKTQAKLLRVIQEKRFERVGGNELVSADVRIIAATNQDIKKMVKETRFRQDLYYRLNVIPITTPTLRERKDDIPLLARHFLEKYSAANNKEIKEISQNVLNTLISHDWPGNVRELENTIERAVVMGEMDEITTIGMPKYHSKISGKRIFNIGCDIDKTAGINLKDYTESCEKEYIGEILRVFRGSIDSSARYLGINEKTLYRKMKRYNFKKDDFRRG